MFARYLFYFHLLNKYLRCKSSKLREIQQKRLKAIVRHAYETVPFYHKKFQRGKIKPDNIRSVEDLAKVPITTKAEVQASSLRDSVAKNVDIDRCVKKTTSGSTGLPLTVVVDERAEDFRGALWTRALRQDGLGLRDRLAIIRDPYYSPYHREWYERIGLVKRKFISVFSDVEHQLSCLEAFKPDVLKGYSSSLSILADFCRKEERSPKPRLVFTGSELLEKTNRRLISSVFGCEPLDLYSCTEFGLLMWECPEHTGYHMNVSSAVFEFAKDGELVAPGESGEILCTDLTNYAMPLIRYRMCDEGVPIEDHCSCGIRLPLMKMLTGRTDDFLISLDGKRISPLIFGPYPFENLQGIKQFRVIQEKRDELKFELVIEEELLNNEHFLEKARSKIKRIFGDGMYVDFEFVDRIGRDSCGKLRKVISRVSEPSV